MRPGGVLIPARGAEIARLASWPRPYPENPYLVRLAGALAGEGVATVSHRYLAALAAAPRGARWLHVHWPEWMLRDSSRARARARALWLFGLLDAARARGVRLAWTAHNLVGHDDPHRDLALAGRRALLARCTAVFGHFAAAEADVRALGFRGRFAVTEHPGYEGDYPPPPARDEARRALGYGAGETVILSFGAIEPYKGLDALAAAFVRGAPGGARLLIAGGGGSKRAVEDARRAAAGDARVRIEAGFVPRERAAVMFAAADACALAYRAFYTSGTAMLALTYGTPVMGPAAHHLATMRGEPFFVEMPAADDVGAAIARLSVVGEGAREAARAWARARTWERVARTVRETLFDGG